MHSPEGQRTPTPAAPPLSLIQPSTSMAKWAHYHLQLLPLPALLHFTAPLTPSQFAASPPACPWSHAHPLPQVNHVGPVPVSLNVFVL